MKKKKKEFHAVVSAFAKFIEKADKSAGKTSAVKPNEKSKAVTSK